MLMPGRIDDSEECGCTPAERASSRRYMREVAIASLGYTALVLISVNTVERVTGIVKVPLALMPMVGIVAISVAMVRFAKRMDELQRQTFIVSAAIAGLACAVITMTLGYLENAGVPRLSMTWVWPITAVAFAIACPFVRRRYR